MTSSRLVFIFVFIGLQSARADDYCPEMWAGNAKEMARCERDRAQAIELDSAHNNAEPDNSDMAARAAAILPFLQQAQPRPYVVPTPHAPRTTQPRNCTTNFVGGTAYTSCY